MKAACQRILRQFALSAPVVLLLLARITDGSEEDSVELLNSLRIHSANHLIHSARLEYTLEIHDEASSPEKIQRRVEEVREVINGKMYEFKDNPAVRQQFEKALIDLDEVVAVQLQQNAVRKGQFVFMCNGPSLGGDRLFRFSMFDQEKKTIGPEVSLLYRSRGKGAGESLHYDRRDKMAVAGPNSISAGSQEPHMLGHLVGVLDHLAGDDESSGRQIDVKSMQVTSASNTDFPNLHLLTIELHKDFEIALPNGKVSSVQVFLDVTKGFITPLIREINEVGAILREWECNSYFRPSDDDLWFPRRCVYREFKGAAGTDVLQRSELYAFSAEGVYFNRDVTFDKFQIELDAETVLFDVQSGGDEKYVVANRMNLSLDDLQNLKSHTGLGMYAPPLPIESNRQDLSMLSGNNRNWFIIGNAVIAISAIGFLVIRRKRRA